MSLQAGLKALQEQHYSDAIALLSSYCQEEADQGSPYYIQAQIALARAYRGHNKHEQALAICEKLQKHPKKEVKSWATGFMSMIKSQENSGFFHINAEKSIFQSEKAGRLDQQGVRLLKPKVADSLFVSFWFTVILIWGIIITIILFLGDMGLNGQGLAITLGSSAIFLVIGLAIAPKLMDQLLHVLYGIHWENLTVIRQHSEESAEIILQVCRENNLKFPLLGIIDYPVPLACSYGSFWGKDRIIVSEGLFNYLDQEEIATVYAHELGLILSSDQGLTTLLSLPSPLLNWIVAYLIKPRGVSEPFISILKLLASFLSQLSNIITYPIMYLSRTRTYHADLIASEITGNPNGLIRALAKAAYGMVEEQSHHLFPNRLEMGITAINLYNPQNAVITGISYRQHSAAHLIGQIFLWDLYNPWAWWLELISTHPLTGRRIKVLTNYAERMELDTEFNMATVILREASKLNPSKLRFNFVLDWIAIALPLMGILSGMKIGSWLENVTLLQGICWGFGVGIWMKTLLVRPFFTKKLLSSDIFNLMADPYASPVRGRPANVPGQLVCDLENEMVLDANLQLQDGTGRLKANYTTRLGELTDFKPLDPFIDVPIKAVGWFYRGIVPSVDLSQLHNGEEYVSGYPRFSSWILGGLAILLGLFV